MNNFIFKKYVQFIERNGYFPMMFNPYNCSEIFDVSPTLTANCGSKGSFATVLITNLGDEEMNKDIAPVMVGGIGEINFGKQYRQGNRIYDANSIAMALLSSPVGNAGGFSYLYMIGGSKMNNLRIRKLTPKECFRLMGFDDEDFYKAEAVNSNTQLFKQAGNSIVVNCIEEILINLFKKGR